MIRQHHNYSGTSEIFDYTEPEGNVPNTEQQLKIAICDQKQKYIWN